MGRNHRWTWSLGGALAVALLASTLAVDATAQPRGKAFEREFILTAEIVASEPVGKGVTNPWRLTLSDGTVTHDVLFQSVNERRDQARLGGGSNSGLPMRIGTTSRPTWSGNCWGSTT
jgi:hypothetical protein